MGICYSMSFYRNSIGIWYLRQSFDQSPYIIKYIFLMPNRMHSKIILFQCSTTPPKTYSKTQLRHEGTPPIPSLTPTTTNSTETLLMFLTLALTIPNSKHSLVHQSSNPQKYTKCSTSTKKRMMLSTWRGVLLDIWKWQTQVPKENSNMRTRSRS